ncbi:hypothetical protein NA57DRAFT_71502 [Rhizodiscina lignyota]|uniref:Fucose-specific lectin n=1 Tax=Rhizodiscina lignyota TaxID=1504668 RepID=A0A9P4IQQ4_9PEZI|nr:hypothetical protein NA57DRAFT_71502 [Rhizodiscina lignyota]
MHAVHATIPTLFRIILPPTQALMTGSPPESNAPTSRDPDPDTSPQPSQPVNESNEHSTLELNTAYYEQFIEHGTSYPQRTFAEDSDSGIQRDGRGDIDNAPEAVWPDINATNREGPMQELESIPSKRRKCSPAILCGVLAAVVMVATGAILGGILGSRAVKTASRGGPPETSQSSTPSNSSAPKNTTSQAGPLSHSSLAACSWSETTTLLTYIRTFYQRENQGPILMSAYDGEGLEEPYGNWSFSALMDKDVPIMSNTPLAATIQYTGDEAYGVSKITDLRVFFFYANGTLGSVFTKEPFGNFSIDFDLAAEGVKVGRHSGLAATWIDCKGSFSDGCTTDPWLLVAFENDNGTLALWNMTNGNSSIFTPSVNSGNPALENLNGTDIKFASGSSLAFVKFSFSGEQSDPRLTGLLFQAYVDAGETSENPHEGLLNMLEWDPQNLIANTDANGGWGIDYRNMTVMRVGTPMAALNDQGFDFYVFSSRPNGGFQMLFSTAVEPYEPDLPVTVETGDNFNNVENYSSVATDSPGSVVLAIGNGSRGMIGMWAVVQGTISYVATIPSYDPNG